MRRWRVCQGILCPLPIIPRYIKDTTDFINKVLENSLKSDNILTTMDATSHHTNFLNKDWIKAVLEHCTQGNHHRILDVRWIRDPLRLIWIVTKNNFEFSGHQIEIEMRGTAIGTRVAPSIENNNVHGKLETKLRSCHQFGAVCWSRLS